MSNRRFIRLIRPLLGTQAAGCRYDEVTSSDEMTSAPSYGNNDKLSKNPESIEKKPKEWSSRSCCQSRWP